MKNSFLVLSVFMISSISSFAQTGPTGTSGASGTTGITGATGTSGAIIPRVDPTDLSSVMNGMQLDLGQLTITNTTTLLDVTENQAMLTSVVQDLAHWISVATQLVPPKVEALSSAQQATQEQQYQAQMQSLATANANLLAAILAGNQANAQAAYNQIVSLRNAGHKQFK